MGETVRLASNQVKSGNGGQPGLSGLTGLPEVPGRHAPPLGEGAAMGVTRLMGTGTL